MNPRHNNFSKTILDYREKHSSLDFDFDVEDLSLRFRLRK